MKQSDIKNIPDWHTRQCYLILKRIHGQEYAEKCVDTAPILQKGQQELF